MKAARSLRFVGPLGVVLVAVSCMDERAAAPGADLLVWSGQAVLRAPDGADRFGQTLAVSAGTAVIGASDAAYVFVRSGATWSLQQQLFTGDPAAVNFGFAVAVSGDTAIVAAAAGGSFHGAAYVFARSGSSWSRYATPLFAGDAGPNSYFTGSVALSGDTALVGNPDVDEARGAAYVFVCGDDSCPQQAKLSASGDAGDQLGKSVALSGDTAVAGAPEANGEKGAAYVFVRSGATWVQEAKLTPTDNEDEARFGTSVAVDGDTVLVGAQDQGAVYVFTRVGSAWQQQAKLITSDGAGYSHDPGSSALGGETVVIGVRDSRAAYLFARQGSSWPEQVKMDGTGTVEFGGTVATSADTTLISSPAAGEVFVFALKSRDELPGATMDLECALADGERCSQGTCYAGVCTTSLSCRFSVPDTGAPHRAAWLGAVALLALRRRRCRGGRRATRCLL